MKIFVPSLKLRGQGSPAAMQGCNPVAQKPRLAAGSSAFSLIELLVVISIIALLAAIGLPALRGFGESNAMDAAKRQMLDDLALARLRAINERTTVYLLFMPPEIVNARSDLNLRPTNLFNHQYTAYTMFTKRGAGEQPGRERPRYLMEWRHLPDGIFIATNKFARNVRPEIAADLYQRPFYPTLFDYSTKLGVFSIPYRYIAFNGQGQLASRQDEVIPLAKGAIFYDRNGRADVTETPRFNYTNNIIRINWLTGRAKVEKQELR